MNKKNCKIGVFDSGLGGVTVLKSLLKDLPYEEYIYYGDSGNAPYGSGKTKEEIQNLCAKIMDFLIENNCKVVVIACNTATVAALEYLKEKYSIPIIGIIDSGAKIAVQNSSLKKVAVFSTEFTANSNAYKNTIQKYDRDFEVIQVACIEFCPMIEKGWETYDNNQEILEKYINKIPNDVDALVLGCTHYPIIEDYIKKKFNKIILDPAVGLSFELKKLLKNLNIFNDNKIKKKPIFFTTGEIDKFKLTAEKFLGEEIEVYKIPK
ncbi:glutamate racemase [Fusobacterium polymorphum]|uniref:glutamate racemase n=1 Tax=Fusobacterium nucleatum subsp. polymorphum TaxID=76857 RepID=UPI00300B0A5A